MQNRLLSIRKIVSYLNNDEAESGGFWLPNIQRPFVWTEEQIARLFDSIMREYPISTLLVWKTKDPIRQRRFIDTYTKGVKLSSYFIPENKKSKLLILDGQQRLQSLIIGLRGSYDAQELYFDVLSGDLANPDDIRFRFKFLSDEAVVWPWIKFKDLIFTNKLDIQIADQVLAGANEGMTESAKNRVRYNVARARQEFVLGDNITYQELDGIDDPDTYKVDDIVEIFIRANSGGTKLGKSDLMFSLLTSSWEESEGEMEVLLADLNESGFEFDRDFVLKTCLTLLGRGARYEVGKFRDGHTKEEIILKWNGISDAIKTVRDYVLSETYIRTDKAIPSYLALIPLIYFCFHYPKQFAITRRKTEYLLRSLVSGVFSGNPDNLIDKIIREINSSGTFDYLKILDVIRDDGRSLEITPDLIFQQAYGSRTIHLFFNIWYSQFNYSPALNANGPQVDHIFPSSALAKIKTANPESGKLNLLKYRAEDRDQIANCRLVTAGENGFEGKSAILPEKWFALDRFSSKEDQQKYLDLHLIPSDSDLWKIENFERFVEARKVLIEEKFSFMLRERSSTVTA